ncbi:hypothetical protein O6H91_08G099000 [Diphasiastrum complanatum]|uniref:Uncharacterized protein n=1 Tax=Diphasiastrum complanatum TaxID=34168 RepID=A0ACC2D049_DIPCM|nr:hypothetical protein O6H91_08G099000 [Diphasiastrum complanatum]
MMTVEEYKCTSTTDDLSSGALCELLQFIPSELQSTNDSVIGPISGNMDSCVSFVGSNRAVSDSIHWWEIPHEHESLMAYTPPVGQARLHVSSTSSATSLDHGIIRSLRFDDIDSQAIPLVSSAAPSKTASWIAEQTAETMAAHRTNHDSDNESQLLKLNNGCGKRPTRPGRSMAENTLMDSLLPTADEIGLQWKISELRVALRASERVRHASELELEAMRKYLSKVEAAAAGLNHRVQQLQHLVLCLGEEGKNVEQAQGKLIEEASKEARNQTTAATTAVAAARKATMELDKVRRYASSIINSQEEEIRRLSIETAHCHLLYQARGRHLQNLKDQLVRLELTNAHQLKIFDAALRASNTGALELQKMSTSTKVDEGDARGTIGTMEVLGLRKNVDEAEEQKLNGASLEKNDSFVHDDECLKHQATKSQHQEVNDIRGNYNHELREVRTVLGGEKAQLLAELALLRCRNKSLKGNLEEWQGKFKVLRQHIVGLERNHHTKHNLDDLNFLRQIV